jgi:hypothetical protein
MACNTRIKHVIPGIMRLPGSWTRLSPLPVGRQRRAATLYLFRYRSRLCRPYRLRPAVLTHRQPKKSTEADAVRTRA